MPTKPDPDECRRRKVAANLAAEVMGAVRDDRVAAKLRPQQAKASAAHGQRTTVVGDEYDVSLSGEALRAAYSSPPDRDLVFGPYR